MRIKTLINLILVAAVLFVGVKFSLAYINYMQLGHVMEAEALDARRTKTSADEILRRVRERAVRSSIELPPDEAVEYTVEGVNKPDEDLVITASYVEQVNLLVYVVQWPRTVVARAETPRK